MASVASHDAGKNLKKFTDCMYFTNGFCKLNNKCQFRHCREAVAQTNNCFKWPKTCRNVKCPYRHPGQPKLLDSKTKTTINPLMNVPASLSTPPISTPQKESLISFFWDIENVPIPKSQKPFDIVQRIRQQLVVHTGLREYSFSCFCNSTTISQDNQLSLFHSNVRIVHVPDRKPGAIDRQIMLELDRFERAHQPPATIVLISGDIDFVGKLSDLRHQAGFHVIVIHNKPAKQELKATVNAHYPWEFFVESKQSITEATNNTDASNNERKQQSTRNQNNRSHQRPKDPSPNPPRSATTKKLTHECPKCTSVFESIQALRQHQDAKDHLFECPICDEPFVTHDGLLQHQKAKDHYERTYLCGQCNRSFAKIESLTQHQQSTNHHMAPTTLPINTDRSPLAHRPPPPPPISVFPLDRDQYSPFEDVAKVLLQKGLNVLNEHYPMLFGPK